MGTLNLTILLADLRATFSFSTHQIVLQHCSAISSGHFIALLFSLKKLFYSDRLGYQEIL